MPESGVFPSPHLPERSRATVQRTLDPHRTPIQNMGVEHGCAHVGMAQQFLNRADVASRFQQVSRETMSKRMTASGLQYPSAAYRSLNRPLHHLFVHMVTNGATRIWILAVRVGREEVLPTPL